MHQFTFTHPLSSAEASLYCGEAFVVGAGEKEKESARGTMGRGKREDILMGYPAGASAEERVTHPKASE